MDSKSVSIYVCLFAGMLIVSIMATPVSKPGIIKSETKSSQPNQEVVIVREGRQFGYPGGFGGSNSNAFASANSQSFGGGFPGGFGTGGEFSSSSAQASAGANGFGIGK